MTYITLNRLATTPLYLQLYTYFLQEITTGKLKPHSKMPSIRNLAKNLNLQYKIQNQMLHSWIIHTPDGRQWEAPVPESFQPFIKQQRSQT